MDLCSGVLVPKIPRFSFNALQESGYKLELLGLRKQCELRKYRLLLVIMVHVVSAWCP